jgi:hypothetical protein
MDMLGYMLLLSTVVPVAGSVGVAIHWLVKAWITGKKTRAYHCITDQITTEASAKFTKDDSRSYDWIEKETETRLKKGGFKTTDGLTVGDIDAASRVGAFPTSLSQQIDQWVLIITAVLGVILMGFSL